MTVPNLIMHPPPWICYPAPPIYVPRLTHTDDDPPRYDEPWRPDATVIIPTRGDEPFLAEVLDALQSERLVLEVLVIDDPEFPSSTRAVVAAFRKSLNRRFEEARVYCPLDYIEQDERGGKAGAMNQGVRLARSDVLVFMDADAVPQPGLVKEALTLLRDCDVVSAQRRHEIAGWAVLTEPFLPGVRFVTPWFCVMMKQTLAKYGGFRDDYLEDVEFWIRARDNGCQVRFTERRVNLKRRVRHEYAKFFHTLRHMMRSPHSHR